MSVAAKSLINLVIEPIVPGTPLSALRDQFYPYPPGRFAITHYEHRHDGWPDYSDGVYGEISSCLGGFIARFVAFDSVEIIVFFGLAIPYRWICFYFDVRQIPLRDGPDTRWAGHDMGHGDK